MNGVSCSEFLFSTWKVVDATRNDSILNIDFPQSHVKQKQIAREFQQVSAAGFNNCCGCMDGLLTWINKPNENDVSFSSVCPKKFFCGHKGNFGLNTQGVCHLKGRFLDVNISDPVSTSDYLAFVIISLHAKLLKSGF